MCFTTHITAIFGNNILVAYPVYDDHTTSIMKELTLALSNNGHKITVLPPMKTDKYAVDSHINAINIPPYEVQSNNWFYRTTDEINTIEMELLSEAQYKIEKLVSEQSPELEKLSKIEAVLVPLDHMDAIAALANHLPKALLITVSIHGFDYDAMNKVSMNVRNPKFFPYVTIDSNDDSDDFFNKRVFSFFRNIASVFYSYSSL